MGISFVLPGYDNIDLKPKGKNILLDIENIEEYLHLVTDYTFSKTIKFQIAAFREGFNQVKLIAT